MPSCCGASDYAASRRRLRLRTRPLLNPPNELTDEPPRNRRSEQCASCLEGRIRDPARDGRALVGVLACEFLAANAGIGFYISLKGSFFRTAEVFFGIIILGVGGLALGELVRHVEKCFDRWRPALA